MRVFALFPSLALALTALNQAAPALGQEQTEDMPAGEVPLQPTRAPASSGEDVRPTPAGPALTEGSSAPPAPPSSAEIEAALAADEQARAESLNAPPSAGAGGGSIGTASAGAAPSMNPDLSFILDVAAAYFSEDDNLQSGAHDPTRNGFNLQQLELAISSIVDPYFRFDGNLVFGLFGVELEEAYGTTLSMPLKLQARFGQFLHRFGRINATHPHGWDFVDQPFAIGRVFGSEGGRGLGVELSWLTPLPWYVELAASAQNADGAANARSFYGGDDLGVKAPGDLLYVTALKQFFALGPDWSLLWGLSAAFGPNSTGRTNRTDVYGSDLYLKYRPITRQSFFQASLQTEWIYRRRQVPDDVLWDVSSYSQVALRFAQRWGGALRYEYGSAAESVEDRATTDLLDPDWIETRQRWSANVTFWPTEFSRLRLQGGRDLPGWRDPIWVAFLGAELVVGAHGAHSF